MSYEINVQAARHRFHMHLPEEQVWSYDGIVPGPTSVCRGVSRCVLIFTTNDGKDAMTNKQMLLKTALAAAGSPLLVAAARAPSPGPRAGYFPNALLQTHESKHVRFYDDVVKGDKIVVGARPRRGNAVTFVQPPA